MAEPPPMWRLWHLSSLTTVGGPDKLVFSRAVFASSAVSQVFWLVDFQISAHSTVTDSLHIDGTVMMVTPNDQEDQDDLVSSTNDLYIYEEKYRESVSITSIPFHVEAISQLPQHSDDSLVAGSRSYTFNQLMSSRKALMVVTARKCYLLEKSYPVDILEKLLRMYSPMSPQMREFVEYLPPFQSCFLALHLACITNSSEISRLATRLLRVYGGEPSFSSDVTAVGRNLTMVQRSINPSPDIVYSAKHDAFFYLVARTVGPLWNVHPFVFGAEYKGTWTESLAFAVKVILKRIAFENDQYPCFLCPDGYETRVAFRR